MANAEQLKILKQGARVWNKWRTENPEAKIDLNGADLRGADLSKANLNEAHLVGARLSEANLNRAELIRADLIRADLSRAELIRADFIRADLSRTDLSRADLSRAYLKGADLTEAILTEAVLREANLNEANLNGANLSGARLFEANLSGANLGGANLNGANLSRANLRETNLGRAHLDGVDLGIAEVGLTNFSNVNLRAVLDLEKVKHFAPSTIGTDTLQQSHGKIPKVFLRGCGLSDWEIEQAKLNNPDLSNEEIIQIQYKVYELRATQAIQISPLFISYSQIDGTFVDRLESQLNAKGIRFWRDIHDMKAGRMEKQIDRAIRQNPTVLLVLSEHSLTSDWVEHEVRTARELEKDMGRDVLCPVTLDDSWKDNRWEKRLMEQVMKYNILDFSEWKDDNRFSIMFRKLIDGLELFYKGEDHGE